MGPSPPPVPHLTKHLCKNTPVAQPLDKITSSLIAVKIHTCWLGGAEGGGFPLPLPAPPLYLVPCKIF